MIILFQPRNHEKALLYPYQYFNDLSSYVEDKNAMNTYINSLTETLEYQEQRQSYEDDHIRFMYEYSINNGISVFSNFMIVHISSSFEEVLKDAFLCYFWRYPERILYCESFNQNSLQMIGFSFKEFLGFDTKEEYLLKLCQSAANLCVSGTPKRIINRLEDLFSLTVHENIKDRMLEIYEIRNRVVHENDYSNFDTDWIKVSSYLLKELIQIITDRFKEIDIAVDELTVI